MSLRTGLLFWLATMLTLVAIAGAGYAYWWQSVEADEFLDRQQQQIARFVGDLEFLPAKTAQVPIANTEDDYVVSVSYSDGRAPKASHPEINLPAASATGFSNFATNGADWRMFTLVLPERAIRVAQRMEVRTEIASDSALASALPILLSIPLTWLVLVLAMGAAFRPLRRTAAAVEARMPEDTTPVSVHSVPIEVRPLVIAFNDLIARFSEAMKLQRQFLADAAHALRTPLAALSVQIGNVRTVARDDDVIERLEELERGARRASALTHKLLVLARSDATAKHSDSGHASLVAVVTEALADLMPLAIEHDIDLGFRDRVSVEVAVPPEELRTLVDILVDNAIRYTPPGGTVDLSVTAEADGAHLQVTDTGRGIAAEHLPKVFERFYRATDSSVEGTGLGLSIARSIGERCRLSIDLVPRRDRSGLVATVRFPPTPDLSLP